MQFNNRVIRSVGTSLVAVFLVAGAAFATSTFVGGGTRIDDSTPASDLSTGAPTDATETAEPTFEAEASPETGSESPSASPETASKSSSASAEDSNDDATAEPSDDHGGDGADEDDDGDANVTVEPNDDQQGADNQDDATSSPTDDHGNGGNDDNGGSHDGSDD